MPVSVPTVQIAVPLPLESTFTYRWPPSLAETPCIGRRVLVPFGKRQMAGYVVDVHAEGAPPRTGPGRPFVCRDVLEVLDDEPLFDAPDLGLYRWISEYYLTPLGETLRTALPVSMHLRTSRAVRVLPRGLLALKQGLFLTRQETEILSLLEKSGKRSLKSLQQQAGGAARGLRELEEKGFLEACQWVRGRRTRRPSGEIVVESTLAASDPSLASYLALLDPREARVLQALLARGGPCLKSDLDRPEEDTGTALSRLLDKGFVRMRRPEEGLPDDEDAADCVSSAPPALTDAQREAVARILPCMDRAAYGAFLLHGVTGSGKTEVYMHLIDAALRGGRDALVLVPEIGLTPQAVHRFRSRFGSHVAVLHSGVLESERMEWWWKIRRGLVKIAIGTRSAVFAPFRNLGIIVVDEEHDPSYKQQDRLRYHARDLALVRGRQGSCTVVLGSATPSLESYNNARSGKSTLVALPERIESRPLPPITCLDVRDRALRLDPQAAVSLPLEQALRDNLEAGRKSLLFLNRRGYAPTVICTGCGHLFRCPRCSVTLTYHRTRKRICCHYCEHHETQPSRCPACGGASLQAVGRGTERIEEEIRERLPEARIGRMDRDTTRKRGSHARLLRQLRGDELDILVGTQMIAKGHDIPDITLVGVIQADTALDLPDFRASERTFQLLLQVAGRAGRGPWPGRVLVQTRHPDHYCLQALGDHDYEAFYRREIEIRRELGYPPFTRMINLRVSGLDELKTARAAARLGDLARAALREPRFRKGKVEVLGPSQAPLGRIRGRYRHHCFLKGEPPRLLLALAREIMGRARASLEKNKIQLEVDVDPIQVL